MKSFLGKICVLTVIALLASQQGSWAVKVYRNDDAKNHSSDPNAENGNAINTSATSPHGPRKTATYIPNIDGTTVITPVTVTFTTNFSELESHVGNLVQQNDLDGETGLFIPNAIDAIRIINFHVEQPELHIQDMSVEIVTRGIQVPGEQLEIAKVGPDPVPYAFFYVGPLSDGSKQAYSGATDVAPHNLDLLLDPASANGPAIAQTGITVGTFPNGDPTIVSGEPIIVNVFSQIYSNITVAGDYQIRVTDKSIPVQGQKNTFLVSDMVVKSLTVNFKCFEIASVNINGQVFNTTPRAVLGTQAVADGTNRANTER